MARNQKDFTFDAATILKTSGAITSNTGHTPINVGAARMDGRAIVDISALVVGTSDNLYSVEVQCSPDVGFATTVVVAGALRLGHATATGLVGNSVVGRYEIGFSNEVNGVTYPFVRLYTRPAGTTPSITASAVVALDA